MDTTVALGGSERGRASKGFDKEKNHTNTRDEDYFTLHNPAGQKQQINSLQTIWEPGHSTPRTVLHNQASSSDRLCICTNTNSPSACSTTEQTLVTGGNGKLLSKKGNESLVLKDRSTLRNGMWTSMKLSRRCPGSK